MAGVEQNKQAYFSVYPNPADDEITVAIPATIYNHSYTITDRLGKIVMTGTLNSQVNTVSIKNLSAGLYIMRIEGVKDVVKLEKY